MRGNVSGAMSAAFLLGTSTNLLSAKLTETEGVWWWLVVLGFPVLFFLFSGPLNRITLGRFRPSASTEPAEKRKGLVVLASPREGIQTAAKAIEFHRPVLKQIWIVYSRGDLTSSEEAALKLRQDLIRENGFKPDQIREIPLSDEAFKDPEEVRSAIESEVYAKLPESLTESDVIIDITGGTKTTTAGALLAGLPEGRRLQFTPPADRNIRGQGISPRDPLEIEIDYKIKKVRRR
jgi:hypothetical protein